MQIRRCIPVAAGAAIWWALYRWNLQFWNWMIYNVGRLPRHSRLGESVHFFCLKRWVEPFVFETKLRGKASTPPWACPGTTASPWGARKSSPSSARFGPTCWWASPSARQSKLEANTLTALAELGVDADIEKVTDPAEIASWGVMSTPALVVDAAVLLSGRLATADEVRRLLTQS